MYNIYEDFLSLYSLRDIHLLLGLILRVGIFLIELSLLFPDTSGRGPGSDGSASNVNGA